MNRLIPDQHRDPRGGARESRTTKDLATIQMLDQRREWGWYPWG